jgi:folate-binding protein YgfZ
MVTGGRISKQHFPAHRQREQVHSDIFCLHKSPKNIQRELSLLQRVASTNLRCAHAIHPAVFAMGAVPGVLPSFACVLRGRTVLRVTGPDAKKFLQGLITADLRHLPSSGASAYAVFLNSRGRVEFDVLISRDAASSTSSDAYIIDCASARADDLRAHLTRYRLRAAVDVGQADGLVVAAAKDADTAARAGLALTHADPRCRSLGLRGIVDAGDVDSDRDATGKGVYEAVRMGLGVPEGADEFGGAPLPLEMGLAALNGVSFEKGCYLGQELTARTHFTGMVRKMVAPFFCGGEDEEALGSALRDGGVGGVLALGHERVGANMIQGNVKVDGKGKSAGRIVGFSEGWGVGLAVLRVDEVFGLHKAIGKSLISETGVVLKPWRPSWWPDDGSWDQV